MKTAKHFLLLICILSLVLSLSLIATAEEIQPYALPTLNSTICPTCSSRMSFEYETYDAKSVTISNTNCENTAHDAVPGESHKHNYKYYYDVYACTSCGTWGRIYDRTTIQCEIGMNDYSLR